MLKEILGKLSAFKWLFPLLLLLALLVPTLRTSVGESYSVDQLLVLIIVMFAQFILASIWLWVEFYEVTNLSTPIWKLRNNVFLSNIMIVVLTLFVGVLLPNHGIVWGTIIPWLAAFGDMLMSPDRALNTLASRRSFLEEGEEGHG